MPAVASLPNEFLLALLRRLSLAAIVLEQLLRSETGQRAQSALRAQASLEVRLACKKRLWDSASLCSRIGRAPKKRGEVYCQDIAGIFLKFEEILSAKKDRRSFK